MSQKQYESPGIAAPLGELRYLLEWTNGDLIVHTFRRVADEPDRRNSACRGGEPEFVNVRWDPGPGLVHLPGEPLTLSFSNEYRAQSDLLDCETLAQVLRTIPWRAESSRQCVSVQSAALSVTSTPGRVVHPTTSEELQAILSQPGLLDISFVYVPSPADIAALASRGRVMVIRMNNRRMDDSLVAQLQGMKCLLHLDLSGSGITNQCSDTIRELQSLKQLNVSNTRLTNEFFLNCEVVGRLVVLSMSETGSGNECGSIINVDDQLRYFDVSRTPVSDPFFLDRPERWGNVISINVGQTQITDRTVEFLAESKNMMVLKLDFCPVTWLSLKKFCGHAQLKHLSLRGVKITDAEYHELRESVPQCLVSL